MTALKQKLWEECRRVLEERIRHAQTAMDSVRAAAADETKSSAGDKYETAREMLQQEVNRYAAQAAAARADMQLLARIKPEAVAAVVVPGSLVHTGSGYYYVAVSAGRILAEGITVQTVSAASPIGRMLIGQRPGAGFSFNGNSYTIIDLL